MSNLGYSDIAQMVVRRFNGPQTDEIRYIPLVDPALRQLSYDVAKDPSLRHWLLTDPASTTVTLDAEGVADLTDLIDDPRIILECLDLGDIYPPVNADYSTQPFRLVDSFGQFLLPGNYDSLVLKATLDGFKLRTKSPDNNATPLVGDISLQVNYWPTLTQLPESLVEHLVWGAYWQQSPVAEAQNAA